MTTFGLITETQQYDLLSVYYFNNLFIQKQTMQDAGFNSALDVLRRICCKTDYTVFTLGNTLTLPNMYIMYNSTISILK